MLSLHVKFLHTFLFYLGLKLTRANRTSPGASAFLVDKHSPFYLLAFKIDVNFEKTLSHTKSPTKKRNTHKVLRQIGKDSKLDPP